MTPRSDIFGIVMDRFLEHPDEEIIYVVERDDNYIDLDTPANYFKPYKEWVEEERQLVELAEGRVLDVGCGAGRHALYLQEQGHEVVGLDLSPGVLDVARKRGVVNTVQGSILHLTDLFEEDSFDTILVLGNNLPLSGSAQVMQRILDDMAHITTGNGKVLLNFVSPVPTDNTYHLSYHKKNEEQGKPKGMVKFRLRYKNHVGDWFDFYLPTIEEFKALLDKTPWTITNHQNIHNLHYIAITT